MRKTAPGPSDVLRNGGAAQRRHCGRPCAAPPIPLVLIMASAVTLSAAVQNASRPALSAAASCDSLSSLTLPDTTMTLAQAVPSGGFSRPTNGVSAAEQGFSTHVAFCRVAATLKPSPDSDIKVEVWLPVTGWNGKFQAVGNGGWGGITRTCSRRPSAWEQRRPGCVCSWSRAWDTAAVARGRARSTWSVRWTLGWRAERRRNGSSRRIKRPRRSIARVHSVRPPGRALHRDGKHRRAANFACKAP